MYEYTMCQINYCFFVIFTGLVIWARVNMKELRQTISQLEWNTAAYLSNSSKSIYVQQIFIYFIFSFVMRSFLFFAFF